MTAHKQLTTVSTSAVTAAAALLSRGFGGTLLPPRGHSSGRKARKVRDSDKSLSEESCNRRQQGAGRDQSKTGLTTFLGRITYKSKQNPSTLKSSYASEKLLHLLGKTKCVTGRRGEPAQCRVAVPCLLRPVLGTQSTSDCDWRCERNCAVDRTELRPVSQLTAATSRQRKTDLTRAGRWNTLQQGHSTEPRDCTAGLTLPSTYLPIAQISLVHHTPHPQTPHPTWEHRHLPESPGNWAGNDPHEKQPIPAALTQAAVKSYKPWVVLVKDTEMPSWVAAVKRGNSTHCQLGRLSPLFDFSKPCRLAKKNTPISHLFFPLLNPSHGQHTKGSPKLKLQWWLRTWPTCLSALLHQQEGCTADTTVLKSSTLFAACQNYFKLFTRKGLLLACMFLLKLLPTQVCSWSCPLSWCYHIRARKAQLLLLVQMHCVWWGEEGVNEDYQKEGKPASYIHLPPSLSNAATALPQRSW